MTRVLALAGQSKVGCITQRRFAKAGAKTHSQQGAALDPNGLSVSTETACRFEPKSPVGNSEICNLPTTSRIMGVFYQMASSIGSAVAMFFTFPEDARWNAKRQAVEFGGE